jgi:hypothetical protein
VDGVDGLIGLEEGSEAWVGLHRGEAGGLVPLACLVGLGLILGDPGGNGARITKRRTAISLWGIIDWPIRPRCLGIVLVGT